MPQVTQAPAWYDDAYYIGQKVIECNTIKFANKADWNADSVRASLAQAYGEEIYSPDFGYSNFIDSGNAENCSPNPLFNVMEYVYAKAEQLNAMQNGQGYQGHQWTGEQVLKFFEDHNITAWDHFTTNGQFENVNPSNNFDLSDFYAKKAEQCNSMEFDGKNDWDEQSVMTYFRDHAINAVEVAVNAADPNVVPVEQGERVTVPAGETPWQEVPIQYKDMVIPAGQLDTIGTPDNDNFVVTVAGSQSGSTLVPGSSIDGNGGIDKLTVNMTGNFRGFDEGKGLTGIGEVDLVSQSKSARSFDAEGITGVNTWQIDAAKGVVNLDNLAETGTTVNVANLAGKSTLKVDFDDDVTDGDNAMTLGLDNVGNTTKGVAANIDMAGIEDVTVNAKGSNIADLSGVSDAVNMNIAGAGSLKVTDVAATVKEVNAEGATGPLKLDLSSAVDFQNAVLGEGDDELTITNLEETSEIVGGGGKDNLNMDGVVGIYGPTLTDIETVTLDQVLGQNPTNADAAQRVPYLQLDGSEISGLENLVISGLDAANKANGTQLETVYLQNYDTGNLNVAMEGDNSGNVDIADIDMINFTVGGASKDQEKFTGTLTLADTTALNVVVGNKTEKGDVFDGRIVAPNVETLDITTNYNNLDSSNAPTFIFSTSDNDLHQVSSLTISGFGAVDIDNEAGIGSQVEDLEVDASALKAGLTAAFKNDLDTDSSISFTGGSNTNVVSFEGYESVALQGSQLHKDVFTVVGDGDKVEITGTLNAGDQLNLIGNWTADQKAALAEELGINATTQIKQGASAEDLIENFNNGQSMPLPSGTTITNNTGVAKADYSGVTFGDGNGTITQAINTNGTLGMAQNGTTVAAAPTGANGSDYSASVKSDSDLDNTLVIDTSNLGDASTKQNSYTVSNDGSGTVSITPTADSDLNKLTSLTLDTGSKDGDINVVGDVTAASGPEGTVASNTQLHGLTELVVSGKGNTTVNAGVGSNTTAKLTVDASELNGSFSTGDGGILSAKNIAFTGSAFDDFLTVAPRGAGTDPIDLGKGADTIVYNLGTPFDAGGYAKSTVKLGLNDGVKDTVNVAGTGTGENNKGTIITIEEFVYKQDVVNSIKADDSLISYATFADKNAMENVINTGFAASTNLGATVTLANISHDGTLGFVAKGTNWDVYLVASTGQTAPSAAGGENMGVGLVKIANVALTGVTDVTTLRCGDFSDWSAQ